MISTSAPADVARRIVDPASVADVLLAGVSRLDVLRQESPLDPVADAALSTVLTRSLAAAVTAGPEDRTGPVEHGTLRLYRPRPTLAFTGRDLQADGRDAALEMARQHGFRPVRRPQGGRAAALHRGSVCFDLVLPDLDGAISPVLRLAVLGTVLVDALRELGVDARLGEVPDEYCPGQYSVNARGLVKLVGTAARRVRGAVMLSGVVLVADPEPVRAVVGDVYRALHLPCDIRSVGALAEELPGTDVDSVAAVIVAAFNRTVTTVSVELAAADRDAALAASSDL